MIDEFIDIMMMEDGPEPVLGIIIGVIILGYWMYKIRDDIWIQLHWFKVDKREKEIVKDFKQTLEELK